jgi:NAD(P)-dependent dehydrogenase (short-subunit alcohol dehydrogenase family)
MSGELAGRHVVVTGAAGALGGAVVDVLAEAGARCHLPVRGAAPAALAGRPALEVAPDIDLGDEAAVTAFYAGLPALWASVHLAGGFAMAPVVDTSLADFSAQLALNAATSFLCCREAVRAMRRGGAGGRIVNVAARPVVTPAGGMLAYATAKGAVAVLTRCLAVEVVGDGILVNAVVPSLIDTPANRRAMPDADFAAWPRPAELAAAIRFLVSPHNALTSGALVPVYGRA